MQSKQSSQGAIRRPGPGPVTSGKSLMDAPLIDFSGSEQQPVSLGPAPRLALAGGVRSEITRGLGGLGGLGDLALAGSVAALEFDDEEKASSSIILEAAC